MRTAIQRIRERYHPLYWLRTVPSLRKAIALVDVPVWLRLNGVAFKVRGRIITHGLSLALGGIQEVEPEALSVVCARKFAIESCWDVGANVGFYTWRLLSAVNGIRAVMFEPLPVNSKLIAETIRKAKLGATAELIPMAASEVSGVAMLQTDDVGGATSSLDRSMPIFAQRHWKVTPREIEVRTISIDEARATRQRVDFMKIDAEGHEEAVLHGAHNTLSTDAPLVLIECLHRDYRCLRYLKKFNYRIVDADSLNEEISADSTNFFAFPGRTADYTDECLSLARAFADSGGTL